MVQRCWLCAQSLPWAHQLVSSPPLTWHGCYRISIVVLVVFRISVHLCQAPSSGLMASSPSSGHRQLPFVFLYRALSLCSTRRRPLWFVVGESRACLLPCTPEMPLRNGSFGISALSCRTCMTCTDY